MWKGDFIQLLAIQALDNQPNNQTTKLPLQQTKDNTNKVNSKSNIKMVGKHKTSTLKKMFQRKPNQNVTVIKIVQNTKDPLDEGVDGISPALRLFAIKSHGSRPKSQPVQSERFVTRETEKKGVKSMAELNAFYRQKLSQH